MDGEPGAALPLHINKSGGEISWYNNLTYSEERLNLKFSVEFGHHNIPLTDDRNKLFGGFRLVVSSLSGQNLGRSEFLIQSVVNEFPDIAFVAQITLKLPEDVIQKQLAEAGEKDKILTQVKFQCN